LPAVIPGLKIVAAFLVLLVVAVFAAPFLFLVALWNPSGVLKKMRLRWIHRNHVQLYDNIWDTPEGYCVNDEGKRWSEDWSKLCPDN
jgi:hypothetical protein